MKRLITLIVFLIGIMMQMSAQDLITGQWKGDLKAVGLRLVFNITENEGNYTSTMDSPNQGVKDIPTTQTTFENNTLVIKIDMINVAFEGILEGDTIKGTFKQSGASFPLNLVKGEIVLERKRPQTPIKPYPYNEEDVKFKNESAGITLAGTFTCPKSGGNFPVVVLVSGSGPQNRDEELLGHKPFWVLSDYLTRQGIAVLRYDDRGTAESEGDYGRASIDDFATDAVAAINYLKTRQEINPEKIGIIGHSEGGLIAFMLAGENPHVGFIVSMAGPAIKGDTLLKAQRYLIAQKNGISDADRQKNEDFIEVVVEAVKPYAMEDIHNNLDQIVQQIMDKDTAYAALGKDLIKKGIMQITSPELKSLMEADPREALKLIRCPVLALNGAEDIQVPADMNLNSIRQLVKSPLTIKKYPRLNHLFQHCETCMIMEYGQLEETISPEVLKDIASWILEL